MVNQVAGTAQAKYGDAKETIKQTVKDEDKRERANKQP